MRSVYRISYPVMEILEKDRNILFTALKLVNVPGVLSRVAGVLGKYNVNILSGVLYGPSDSKVAIWIFSADFTNSKAPPKVVLKEIEKLDIVLSCEYGTRRIGRMLFPPFFVELNLLDRGVIIQRKVWLHEVNRIILEEFGSGAEALFFHIGFRAGYRIVDYWSKASGLKGEDLVTLVLEVVKGLNWISDYEVELNLKKTKGVLRVWDLMDCLPFRDRENKPTSHYFRGIISGYISRVLGRRIVVLETKCIAKGDPYCEFKISP